MAREHKQMALEQLCFAYDKIGRLDDANIILPDDHDILRRQLRWVADYIMVGEEWGEREQPINYNSWYRRFDIGNPGFSHRNENWHSLQDMEDGTSD